MDKIIVPYVKDEEHNAPKYIRPQAYAQIYLSTVYALDMRNESKDNPND